MHEFTKSKGSWYVTGIVDTLIKDGNLCLAIDFRGHGCSSYEGDVLNLIEQPWLLREDFDATLNFLDTIDLERSFDIYENVIGGVAASAVKQISEKMYEGTIFPKGMFYMAGELDKNAGIGIDYEEDANSLYDATKKPAKVKVIEGSAEHGVGLLETNPGLISEAIEWVRNL